MTTEAQHSKITKILKLPIDNGHFHFCNHQKIDSLSTSKWQDYKECQNGPTNKEGMAEKAKHHVKEGVSL